MTRRGLSLLELLVATALLVLTIAVCLPMLTPPREPVPRGQPVGLGELASLADEVMETPDAFGLDGRVLRQPGSEVSFRAMLASGAEDVRVRVLSPSRLDVDHTWVVFECGDVAVSRWVSPGP